MIIALSPTQVANYIKACFFRPNIVTSHLVADKYRKQLDNLAVQGYVNWWNYNTEENNVPTLHAAMVWEATPQGFDYWESLHNTIVERQGYDKSISLVLTVEQRAATIGLGPSFFLGQPNPTPKPFLKVPPKVSSKFLDMMTNDPDDTREII